ncbi:MAG TPA: putative hydro-lyase [Burkholderiales bacterium]|nr:putative hydro-lyase [Burkholderiales bacterium]
MVFDRSDPRAVRLAARTGVFAGVTAGLAPGFVQGNVCILPREFAADFRAYCERNPKPCPLIGESRPGDPRLPSLGEDLDIRTDVPRYRVFRDGKLSDEVADIRELWSDDLVAFVIGCSFSFEEALVEAGVPLRYVAEGKNVAMYLTNIETAPAGPFRGPMAVSMRPLVAADAIRAIQITSRFPSAHGAPVHLGKPELIGIDDLDRPFAGDRIDVRPDELPVFWACGITPQAAVLRAKPPLCITHAPGHMLVTDVRNSEWALA